MSVQVNTFVIGFSGNICLDIELRVAVSHHDWTGGPGELRVEPVRYSVVHPTKKKGKDILKVYDFTSLNAAVRKLLKLGVLAVEIRENLPLGKWAGKT